MLGPSVLGGIDARHTARRRPARLLLGLGVVLAAVLLNDAMAAPAVAAPGSWSGTGALSAARSSHTATRLLGGKVLVAGGSAAAGQLASAELFDPASGSYATAGPLTTGRSSHTATRISGAPFQCGSGCGKVLVVGGVGASGKLASAELFDPASASFTTTSPLTTARTSHTATLLPSGRILVAGGTGPDGQPLASAEVYNPATGMWSATSSLATARSSHTTTLLSDGRVLVAGGIGGGGTPLASAELYDPATGNWTATASMGSPRSSHTATPLGDEISGGSDRRVLVAGGSGVSGTTLASAELYNPQTGSWSSAGSLRTARTAHTAALVSNGRVTVAGGEGAGGKLSSAEVFDPGTGAWSATGSLANARSSQPAAVLLDGRILNTGGVGSSGQPLASSELYDPDLGGRWAATGALANARSGHTAMLLPDGDVLVAGGHTTANFIGSGGNNISTSRISPLSSSERYDPARGTWTTTGALREARSFHTATLLTGSPAQCGSNCGKLLVTGGQRAGASQAETLSSAELYDPATGQWRSTAPMSTPRYWHTATRLRDGKVIVVAGADANGVLLKTAELYDPVTESWTPTGSLTGTTSPQPTDGTARGARIEHTATLLDKDPCGSNCGKVLVAAGVGNIGTGPSLASAELYDQASGTFTATSSLSQSRQLHTDTLLPNGKVLVSGGFNSPFATSFTAKPPNADTGELYNPQTEQWEPTGSLRHRRIYHTATLLADGKVLDAGGVAGGNAPSFPHKPGPALSSSELFDIQGNSWTRTLFMNATRVLHTATLLPSGPASVCGDNCGKVLVAGGDRELIGNFAPYFQYTHPLNSAELYTPKRPPTPKPNPPGNYPPPPNNCPTGTSAGVTCQSLPGGGRRITGTAGNDKIVGTAGNDVINCGPGNDVVSGGAGNDTINCGAGNDRVNGNAGNDRLFGDSGNDRLSGDSGNDSVSGGTGNDRASGAGGRDRLNGNRGNDVVSGNSSNDSVSGSSGRDRVSGGSGNDRVSGNSGNDRVSGDGGRDRVNGGSGRDRLGGGSGNDSISARDRTRDSVNCGSGRDRVTADRRRGRDRVSRNCERVRRR